MTYRWQGMGEPGSPARATFNNEGRGREYGKPRQVVAGKRRDTRRAFLGRGSPVVFYLCIGFPVFKSFLHDMQYSPFPS
ncbi:MAG: hypothetical protein Q6373_011555 [Candidatus Sigynarchaeota archaeon]